MSQINRGNGERGVTLRIRIRKPTLAGTKRLLLNALKNNPIARIKNPRIRWPIIAALAVFVIGTTHSMFSPLFEQNAYALDGKSQELLPEASSFMAEKIDYKMNEGVFDFRPADDSPAGDFLGKPTYSSATLHQDPAKGVIVTDPTNKIDFSMKPQFKLKEGRQTDDKVIYPLEDGSGWLVYTLRGNGVKEDIVLSYAKGDTQSYSYSLGLGDILSAKIESDGSLGIYGNTLFSGNVTTATDKDTELLQKARQNAQKDTLLFHIPAPVVLDKSGVAKDIKSKYSLDGNTLTITTTGLKKGDYPLTIDPSIYVVTAQQFMQGNNETNVDFDVDNKLIKKGRTTGARFNNWNNTTSLPSASWGGASAPAGGFVYQAGGTGSGGTSSAVNWAQFNTATGAIDSANPGAGACSGWCSDSTYNLPDGRANFSLVAYNGYLYALGGTSSNCTSGNGTGNTGYCDTVYIAKLGANGEPRLWHPSDTNQANWVHWYRDTDLPAERAYTGAAVYNNQLYLVGGRTSSGATTAVSIAPITPTGKLGTWASSGNTIPAANAYSPGVETYNERLYVVGGSSSPTAAPTNTVWYSKINSAGTINTWQQTKGFTTGRVSGGSKITSTWGGYLYISGGCSAVNASGYCTTIESDTQVASINADGSLDNWYVMPGVSDSRFGHSLVAWRNTVYMVGGCSAQDPTTGSCTTTLSTARYGAINKEGDVSTISNSYASGLGTCIDGPPYDCDLPSASVGNVLNAVAVLNGYLYIMGGCTNNDCTTTSTGVTYQSISSDGTLQRPSTCSGSFVDSYCVSSVSLPTGLAASGVAISNDRIYLVGGFGTGTNIYYTATNSDGSIGAWSTTSLATASSSAVTTLTYAYAYIRANPSSAGTNPANLYIIGGCTDGTVTCSNYSQAVLKCNLSTAGAPSGCSTSGQLQIGTIPNSCGTGLGAMAGAVYANYIYLIGGLTTSCSNLKTTRYAKFDNSNNIVAASGSAWTESANQTNTGRQRGAGFGYNGYLYVVGGYDDSGGSVLSDIEFAKINVSDGSIGVWSTSSITISQRWGLNVPVSNSYAYVVGGCTAGTAPSSCSNRTNMVQTFQLYNNNSGAPASYSTSANTFSTDPNRLGMSTAVLNGYIYVAGGCTSTTDYCTSLTSNVSYAAIDMYGNIGSWASTTGSLPASRAWGKLRPVGNTLYFVGGDNTSAAAQTSVYYATPSSGNISSWSTSTTSLPNPRSDFGMAVWNDRLYVVGGKGTGTGCSGVCSTVYVSSSQTSGGNIGSWSTASTSFNVARSGLTAVAYANNLYIFGGYDGGNYLSDSQFAKIDATTGTAGSWAYSESMPQPLSQGDGFAINGYVYLVGGRSGHNTCEPTSLVAPISANTTVASGNNPTGIGTWFETNQKYSGPRFGNGAVHSGGKVYAIGGMNCTGGTQYTSAGSHTYQVPSGVSSITVKMWGGGGGSGGNSTSPGGSGGGGGFTQATLPVTALETLNLTVGAGGGGGGYSSGPSVSAAGGGGYSRVYKASPSTALAIAGGGGGGGAARAANLGGAGGGGGCTTSGTSCAGSSTGANNGGGGGSSSTGGAGGTGSGSGSCAGQTGSSLTGGRGGGWSGFGCITGKNGGPGGTGGALGGGDGSSGLNNGTNYAPGAGAGGGYFGGGGGSSGAGNIASGAGGGGGGSYTIGTATNVTTSIASGATAANSSDSARGTAGNGGYNGGSNSSGSAGNAGLIIIITPTSISPITPVIQQTAVLSQPQVSQYSIMLDTDTDVYPTKWLLNGVDNSIGAHWRLSYKSMTDPTANKAGNGAGMDCSAAQMSNWGQTTNHGDVQLGLLGLYTPLDSSGVNTNCARYFNLNIAISAQETFGYPDDVTRGPTITDLTVNFTADPAKRLMHGRTFIGGLQMPLDTPNQ